MTFIFPRICFFFDLFLVIARSHSHCCCHHIVRFGTMVGKVFVTQTQVRRTWWDHNRSIWVDDAATFLNIMTEQMQQHRRCSCGGAVIDSDRPHSFECNVLLTRLVKQVKLQNKIGLDCSCECRSITTMFIRSDAAV